MRSPAQLVTPTAIPPDAHKLSPPPLLTDTTRILGLNNISIAGTRCAPGRATLAEGRDGHS